MSIKKLIANTFFDFAYAIAYRPVPDSKDCRFPKGGDTPFRLLKPTLGCWYADPLLTELNGKDYLFMEVWDRKKKKGFIGVSEFDQNGLLSAPKCILEEDFHLSFPVVFSYNGRYILMPECSESGTLRFYTVDPANLSVSLLCKIPVSEKLVDTVVYEIKDEKITLLSCAENPGNPKQTSLVMLELNGLPDGSLQRIPLPKQYESPSFFLRNGGPVYICENKKIRILQESTETEYGHNLLFRTVSGLGENYSEEELSSLYLENLPVSLPAYYRKQGTHTYSMTSSFEVIDISFNRFHFGNLFY
ncbi:MAG: hypothetical protein K5879_07980 [Lachnospiraceae bacterium]|nr:hypothetical protein [Lachnospiraceae bacterium]